MLPKELRPSVETELVRVGPVGDGGYVIPEKVLNETALLYGLGVGVNWGFEKQFSEKSGASVVCYDHTVTNGFWWKYFFNGIKRPLKGKSDIREIIRRIRRYKSYREFFDGKERIHKVEKIAPRWQGGVEIADLLEGVESHDVFLKLDIEGSEYDFLEQIRKFSRFLTGLVVEFHDVPEYRDMIVDFVRKLDMPLVHIHGNNCSGCDYNGDPRVIELTFKRRSVEDVENKNFCYPIKELDTPNKCDEDDLSLIFE